VKDELVPFEIPASNGRRYFRNAGRTVRKGAELGAGFSFDPAEIMTAYTYSHFRFDEYTVGEQDFSKNFIPGIPTHRLQAAVRVGDAAKFVVAELEGAGKAWLDDANTTRAPGYWTTSTRAGASRNAGSLALSVTMGIQNIFDRSYSSSLSVNAARGKYFEPAPGRTFLVGLSVGASRPQRIQ